ncbi:MAG: polysaccharide biosynthesis protein, partial [Bacteroidota bacterium]
MIQNYLNNKVERFASKWLVLAIDVAIVCIAFMLSYFIRFNLTFNFDVSKLLMQIPIVGFIALISFLILGSYKGVIRHTGVK